MPSETSNYRSNARRRGLVMVLVVAALVLLVILGLAYLNVARVTRMATMNFASGSAEDVAYATLNRITLILKNDVVDGDGHSFNSPDAEPYDYPYTASDKGQYDDAWLAATYPRITPSQAFWPHVTNINDHFLILPTAANADPTEVDATAAEDTDVSIWSSSETGSNLDNRNFGGDADGDGIPDARWQWAPIPQIAGIQYITAVRIIDSSSMVNFNTGNALTSSATRFGDTSGDDYPRYTHPGEIDLVRFNAAIYDRLNGTAPFVTQWDSDLRRLLTNRLGSPNSGAPVPIADYAYGTTGNRLDFWLRGPAMYGQWDAAYTRLEIENELELRKKNGVANGGNAAPIEDAATGMDQFLRGTASDNDYLDYTLAAFGDDGDATLGEKITNTRRYYATNARVMITTHSGASELAERISEDEQGMLAKKNINWYLNLTPYEAPASMPTSPTPDIARLQEAADEVLKVLNMGDFTVPSGFSGKQAVAEQLIVNLRDYADHDYYLTRATLGSGDVAGLEALPFLGEALIVRSYEVDTVTGSNPTYTLTVKNAGSPGLAIELNNPFSTPLPAESLEAAVLYVNDQRVDTVQNLIGSELGADNAFGPGETAVVYLNPGSSSVGSLESLFNGTPTMTKQISATMDIPETGTEFKVELRGLDADGSEHGWPYAMISNLPVLQTDPGNITVTVGPSSPAPAPDDVGHLAAGRVGRSDGINPVTLAADEFEPTTIVAFADTTAAAIANINNLGRTTKPLGPPAEVNNTNRKNQLIMSNDGGVRRLSEFFTVAMLGPRPSQTDPTVGAFWSVVTGDANGQTTPLDTHFRLDPRSSDEASSVRDSVTVPHSLLIARQFSVLTPLHDRVESAPRDNDDDGEADNPAELFVPGRININTVGRLYSAGSWEIQTPWRWAMYLPTDNVSIDDTQTDAIFEKIIDYRDKTGSFSSGRRATLGVSSYRENPGIAHISELYRIDFDHPAIDDDNADTQQTNGLIVDYNTDPSLGDGARDDREEEMMIADWFAQTCTTRSDVFVAYILVRGYPIRQWSGGPVEVKRFVAIIDRSNIAGTRSNPRILAIEELN